MIIRILGGNGSGKSHLVRSIMNLYHIRESVVPKGKRKPHMIHCRSDLWQPLSIIGHYDIANGGVDTMRVEDAYTLIGARAFSTHVLYESSSMSDGSTRMIELKKCGHSMIVLALKTPVTQCVASVRSRGHTIAERWILSSVMKASRTMTQLQAAGIPVEEHTRQSAYTRLCELLGPREEIHARANRSQRQ